MRNRNKMVDRTAVCWINKNNHSTSTKEINDKALNPSHSQPIPRQQRVTPSHLIFYYVIITGNKSYTRLHPAGLQKRSSNLRRLLLCLFMIKGYAK